MLLFHICKFLPLEINAIMCIIYLVLRPLVRVRIK